MARFVNIDAIDDDIYGALDANMETPPDSPRESGRGSQEDPIEIPSSPIRENRRMEELPAADVDEADAAQRAIEMKEIGMVPVEEKKNFELQAKHLLLTYASAPNLRKETIRDFIKGIQAVKQMVIGEEKHADGTKHFHCYVGFVNRIHTRDVRRFDIAGYHPNIHKAGCGKKSTIEGAIHYCEKEDPKPIYVNINLYNQPNGFIRKSKDHRAWRKYVVQRGRLPVSWPITDMRGHPIPKPEAKNKQRHLWIVSKPNMGKTWWLNYTFREQAIFRVPDREKYHFEGYEQEEVIVYDDVVPASASNLIKLCDTNPYNDDAVPGDTRYEQFYLGRDPRLVIILCNPNRVPEWRDDPAIRARFKFINIRNRWVPDEAKDGGGDEDDQERAEYSDDDEDRPERPLNRYGARGHVEPDRPIHYAEDHPNEDYI